MDDHKFIPKDHLLRLREQRMRPERDLSLGFLADVARRYEREQKRRGKVAEAWERVCPSDIFAQSRVCGLHRNRLVIAFTGSSWLYSADRILRDGGEHLLRVYSGASFRKIRLVLEGTKLAKETAKLKPVE